MNYLSFEKSVGGVVYRRDNDRLLFLLLRYRSGQWDFPKGHVEIGENEEATLRREIMEETGIENLKIVPKFRLSVRYFYVAKGNEKKERVENRKGIYIFKKVIYFAVETESPKVVIDFENKDFTWLIYEDALRRLGNDGSRKVIMSAYKKIKGNK